MKKITIAVLVLFVAAAAASLLLGGGGPEVRVLNRSKEVLTEVTLIGEGWSARVPDLEPGTQATARPEFRGETGMKISFRAGGKNYAPANGTYLESRGGYRVRVAVGEDFSASFEGSVGGL